MEISQASIIDSSVDTKTKLTNDIIRLLQVREKNSEMAKDWLLFLTTTPKFKNIRPTEVYEAFRLAMSRELKRSDGTDFNLLPELSINTTSEVLNQYMAYKKQNPEYNEAKTKLLSYTPVEGPTEEEKAKIREDFLKSVFDDIAEREHSNDAWLLYDDVKAKLPQDDQQKKNLYKQQEHIYITELKQDVAKNEGRRSFKDTLEAAKENVSKGKHLGVVINRCKSIMVSNYLKQFKSDFENFKEAIL